ncbi:MAG: M20 family metallopeptidase [Bacillota bacterium]
MREHIDKKAEEIREQIIEWRRDFHRHPELELQCDRTAEVVSRQLQRLGLEVKTGLAGSGVTGLLTGSRPGPVVALRLDMDALPLEEQTGLPFASTHNGVMHACGHDGHTAIGLGVATILAGLKEALPGSIKFIFQPGEEFPGGAKIMIEEGALADPAPEAIFGAHIFPGLPMEKIGLCYGTMTSRNDEFFITLKGVGGHGAYPHNCKDPIVAAGHLILGIQNIVSRSINPLEPLVITIGAINGGAGCNVIPEKISLKGTIRSINEEIRKTAHERLRQVLEGIKTGQGVHYDLEIIPGDPPLKCDQDLTRFVEEELGRLISPEDLIHISSPSLGAEDFAFYSELIPAVYLRLGSYDAVNGHINPLHTAYFTFNEELMIKGAKILAALVVRYLEKGRR